MGVKIPVSDKNGDLGWISRVKMIFLDEKWYFYLIQIFEFFKIKCQSNFKIIKDDAISWPDLDNRYYLR